MSARAWSAALAAVLLAARASAHEGPPYPVLVDRALAGYTIDVWADPDVGIGTFFYTLEPDASTPPGEPTLTTRVAPLTGRLEPKSYGAERQRDGVLKAEVDFDREELWHVVVALAGPAGSGELEFDIEATPPGYGAWDLLIYFTPFALLGALWVAVAIKRTRERRAARAAASTPDAPR